MGVVFFLIFVFILVLASIFFSSIGIILKSFNLRKKNNNKGLISIFSKLSIVIGCVIGFIAFLFIMFIVIVSIKSISGEYKKKNSLVYCVRACGINEVEKLLDDGVPPDCDKDNNPAEEGTMSAFTYACYGRNPENKVEIVKLLLDYGADINRITWENNHSEETHLTDSFEEEYPYGDFCGYTPLMHACQSGSYDIVRLLVEQGADINAVSYCGFTPLFVAANSRESRSDEIVEYLIEQGADTQIECFTGETAAEFVRRKGDTHMSELINSYADEQYD
ncbi:MAG: hypothetical protein HDT39_09365 [Lachnospiraceae bacterium]|nr:hypothetical protein [Lachnospiraceae bacterium]